MKRVLTLVLSIAIIAGAFALSTLLIQAKSKPKKDIKKHPTMYVKTEKVNYTSLSSALTYRGLVSAYDRVSLASEVSGKLISGDVRFKAGETFKKNEILIHIYSDDVRASLKAAKSSFLQNLSIILPDLKVDYANEYEKWETFFHNIDVETKLPKLPIINSEKEKVFLASNNILSAYYNLQQQEINLSRYQIKAPFNGRLKTVNKEIGAIASPGSELATITSSDKLELIVPVFPNDLTWIQVKDTATITDLNGIKQNAIVSRISDFVDENTQSVNVYLTYFKKADTQILEGQYVDVEFEGSEIVGFEIPRESLLNGNKLYELKDGHLIERSVKILQTLNDSYIISGITAGSNIVCESLATIDDNMEYVGRN